MGYWALSTVTFLLTRKNKLNFELVNLIDLKFYILFKENIKVSYSETHKTVEDEENQILNRR